jgi:glutathione synthase/RimK-type ligase-like ATP-grasp enzyme
MNHPAANARAANKLYQLTVAGNVGLLVPDTIVTQSAQAAREFWERHRGYVVIKPLSVGYVETREGRIEGQIFTSKLQAQHLVDDSLLARCPSFLQEEVRNGSDVRVTIVDSRLTALRLHRHNRDPNCVDIRRGDMTELDYENVSIPERVCASLCQLMTRLDLRFGAADFIVRQDGAWVFLEVNPNGQWAWMDLLGASDIARSFVETFGVES